VLCASTACVGLLAMDGSAIAATTKIYVSHAPVTASGKHSCNKPSYDSIQAAVDGSAFGTVVVCNGTYAEQVVIDHAIVLQGNTGATVVPPGGPSDRWVGPIIQVGTLGSDTLQGVTTVKGLIVDGQDRADVPGTARGSLAPVGIRVENANAVIQGNIVRGVEDPDAFGDQSGLGILVHAANGDTITSAKVTGNTVEDFQKGGIVVDAGTVPGEAWTAGGGVLGSVGTNVVTGIGPTPLTAQNGIQISRGASTSVTGNSVTGTAYTGSSGCDTSCDTASGILLYQAGSGTTVNTNSLSVFDNGIAVQDSNGADIAQNTLNGNRDTETDGCRPVIFGIYADFSGASSGAQAITVENNTLDHLTLSSDLHGCQTGSGIRVDAESDSPAVTSTIKGNSVTDFQKNGIVIRGAANDGKLTLNTVTSTFGTQGAIAQNLIEIAFGATATIGGKSPLKQGNTLNGFGAYTGPSDDSSAGILLYDVAAGVKINNNTFNEGAGLLTPNGASTQGGYTVLLYNDTGSNPGPDVNATRNHWGTGFNATDIAQRIYDGNDDPSSGIVFFNPFTP
jgi:nitrous oxidase accessory protein NosD